MKRNKLQGGFSNEIFQSDFLISYVTSKYPGGYVGALYRTKRRDKMLENFLVTQGLGPESIAEWITSTAGRHMMDQVGRKTTLIEFEKIIKEYAGSAFIDIIVWSHPDGHKIREKLMKRLKAQKEDK